MHQLIAVLEQAPTPTEARGLARSHYASAQYAPLTNAFDSFTPATDLDDSRDVLPREATDAGAFRADTDAAQSFLDDLWEQTQREQTRHLAILNAAFERLDDDQILDNTFIDGVDVDGHQPNGRCESCATERGSVRDSMRALGTWQHPFYRIYDQYGEAVRSPTDYQRLTEQLHSKDDDQAWFVVPLDVHY